MGPCHKTLIALVCFVQHNKHKKLVKSDIGCLCIYLTQLKTSFGPLTIKHLPTPMKAIMAEKCSFDESVGTFLAQN